MGVKIYFGPVAYVCSHVRIYYLNQMKMKKFTVREDLDFFTQKRREAKQVEVDDPEKLSEANELAS